MTSELAAYMEKKGIRKIFLPETVSDYVLSFITQCMIISMNWGSIKVGRSSQAVKYLKYYK